MRTAKEVADELFRRVHLKPNEWLQENGNVWRYDERVPCLYLPDEIGGGYWTHFRGKTPTELEVYAWSRQLAPKLWVSDAILAQFVRACLYLRGEVI